jgi:hypothetical protein
VRSVVRHGVAEGTFSPEDPLRTTMALLSLGIDIARWYSQDATWPPATIAAFYADLALRMVGADTKEKK